MIQKVLRTKIDKLVNGILKISGDLSILQDEITALCDEAYDNGCEDGYTERSQELEHEKGK